MSVAEVYNILLLPEVALEKIFSFLSYDEISRNRLVCKKFNETGGKLLSRGFIQLEKRHSLIYKRVKSALPRRESERKSHPLARHSDILQAVETRMSMLNMTYMRYIDTRIICFIPGKVLDEIKSILDLVESNKTPPRTHQLLQELRDLSSMAMEHFDEHILPKCKEKLEQRTGSPEKILKELEVVAGSLSPYTKFQDMYMYKNVASTSTKGPRIMISERMPQCITTELFKVKKVTKSYKHHIRYLTQYTQRLGLKLRRQTKKLRIQSARIRDQDRKIQEQNSKILEQETALNDIKKHIDEWDQKYKDLTAELVRARDEILLKAASSSPVIRNPLVSQTLLGSDATQSATFKGINPSFRSNIKPRTTHILPKSYLSFDFERKRKSSISPEIPFKRNRSPSAPTSTTCQIEDKPPDLQIKIPDLNIPDLLSFDKNGIEPQKKEAGPVNENEVTNTSEEPSVLEKTDMINTFFDNLFANPLKNVKSRKRKMKEDIDLK